MNERIVDFIQGQKVASICCMDEENHPYCFSCFFAFDEKKLVLYFKSSADTRHAQLLKQKGTVAGTIQPDKLNPLAIKGLQFTGVLTDATDPLAVDAFSVYHKKYPFAIAMKGDVLTIKLTAIKMTDNTLQFGKKIAWKLDSNTFIEA